MRVARSFLSWMSTDCQFICKQTLWRLTNIRMSIAGAEAVFHQQDILLTPTVLHTIRRYTDGLVRLKDIQNFLCLRATREVTDHPSWRDRGVPGETKNANDRYGNRQQDRFPSKATPLCRSGIFQRRDASRAAFGLFDRCAMHI